MVVVVAAPHNAATMHNMSKGLSGLSLHPTLETAVKRAASGRSSRSSTRQRGNEEEEQSWDDNATTVYGAPSTPGSDPEDHMQPEGGDSRSQSQQINNYSDDEDYTGPEHWEYPYYQPNSPWHRMADNHQDNASPWRNHPWTPDRAGDPLPQLPGYPGLEPVERSRSESPQIPPATAGGGSNDDDTTVPDWDALYPDPQTIYKLLKAQRSTTQRDIKNLFDAVAAELLSDGTTTIELVPFDVEEYAPNQTNDGFEPSFRSFRSEANKFPQVVKSKRFGISARVLGEFARPAVIVMTLYSFETQQPVDMDPIEIPVLPDGTTGIHWHKCQYTVPEGNASGKSTLKPIFFFRLELKGSDGRVTKNTSLFQIFARSNKTDPKQNASKAPSQRGDPFADP